jgi:hypothetical protein
MTMVFIPHPVNDKPVAPMLDAFRVALESTHPAKALPVNEEAERSDVGRATPRSVRGTGTVVNENPAMESKNSTVYTNRVSALAVGAAKHKAKTIQSTAPRPLNRLDIRTSQLTEF